MTTRIVRSTLLVLLAASTIAFPVVGALAAGGALILAYFLST